MLITEANVLEREQACQHIVYALDRRSTKLVFFPPIVAVEYILQKTLKELPSGSLHRELEEWKRSKRRVSRQYKISYKRKLRKQLVTLDHVYQSVVHCATKMNTRTQVSRTMLSSAREEQKKKGATAPHTQADSTGRLFGLAPFFKTRYSCFWNVTCEGVTAKAPSESERSKLELA